MERETPFSYQCGHCGYCCYQVEVRLGPYEILRLAKKLGVTTTEFLRRFTDAGGTVLRRRNDGACFFHSGEGCHVYKDRPLQCRLYPLQRRLDSDGVETFSLIELPPASAGLCEREGTVDAYLQQQDTDIYLQAAELYFDLFQKMLDVLNGEMSTLDKVDRDEIVSACNAEQVMLAENSWLDVDSVVGWHCDVQGMDLPEEPWERILLHVELLTHWSENITTGDAL